jgi:hypothetical protein
VDRRLDEAGVDRRDADLVTELEPQRVRVRDDPALGHAVGGCERDVEVGEAGRHVHHAPAGLAQRGESGRGHAPGTDQVHLERGDRALVRRGAGALARTDAGVVHEHVHAAAEALDRLGHGAVHRRLVGHVALDEVRVGGGVHVEADDARAMASQPRDGGGADAARRSGDDHALAHAATLSRSGARAGVSS